MPPLILPSIDVFGHSSHEFSNLPTDFPEENLSSNQSALLDSLLNFRPREPVHIEDMLGEVVYAAKEPGTNLPNLGIHPGRLAALAANGEGHARIDLPCDLDATPDHPHSEICQQYVDLELVRHAGAVQRGLSGSVIWKGRDQIHRAIDFLAISERGFSLIPLPATDLFEWAWPPEPIDLLDGKRVFRDRSVDCSERLRRIRHSRGRVGSNRERHFGEDALYDPSGLGRNILPGAVQGFLVAQKTWVYRDVKDDKLIEVPAVHYDPSPNQDKALMNGWQSAHQVHS